MQRRYQRILYKGDTSVKNKLKYIYDEIVALIALLGIGTLALLTYLFVIMLTPWFWMAMVMIYLIGKI